MDKLLTIPLKGPISGLLFVSFFVQDGEGEVELELEGEVEGACEDEETFEESEDYPAVIVEEVPGASVVEDQGYSAQVFMCDGETYLMQEVCGEQEVETQGEAGETEIQLCLLFKLDVSVSLLCFDDTE